MTHGRMQKRDKKAEDSCISIHMYRIVPIIRTRRHGYQSGRLYKEFLLWKMILNVALLFWTIRKKCHLKLLECALLLGRVHLIGTTRYGKRDISEKGKYPIQYEWNRQGCKRVHQKCRCFPLLLLIAGFIGDVQTTCATSAQKPTH